MNVWPIGTKPAGINYARLRPFGSYEPETWVRTDMPWKARARRTLRTLLGFFSPPSKSLRTAAQHGAGDPVSGRRSFLWDQIPRVPRRTSVPWGELARTELRTSVVYDLLPAVERVTAVPFSNLPPLQRRAAMRYRIPPAAERATAAPWGFPPLRSPRTELPYYHPPRKTRPYAFPWDDKPTPPPGVRPRPIEPPGPPPSPEPVYTPPPGDAVPLDLYCRMRETPGDQVPLRIARVPCAGLDKEHFAVNNTIYLKRVSDAAELHAESVQVAIDYEAYTWELQAAIRTDDALDLLDVAGGSVEVELGLNGYVWRCYVERWSRNREFGDRVVNIYGRGLAAELDAPYSAAASLLETDDLTARQLIEQELGVSSWTATPHATFVDWLVPGDTWSYSNLTPIQAIARICEAVGARAIGARDGRDLLLVPRYPYSPWNWGTSPVDKQLSAGPVVAESGSWDDSVLHRGIYVNGERNGKQVGVTRTGTNGAPWLPSITDPLITEYAAATERGRNELAATGARTDVQRTLPILTGANDPGLVEPSHLVEMQDPTETWRGLCTGVVVNAQWTQEGLTVWQRIDLERYNDA